MAKAKAKEPVDVAPDINLDEALPGDPVLEAVEWTIDNTILVDELAAKIGDDMNLALAVYGRMEDAIQELRKAQDVIGKLAIPLIPKYQAMPVPGGGLFKVGGGTEKKVYENDRLVSVVGKRITEIMDLEKIVTKDGEVGEAPVVIEAVVKKVAELTGAMAPSFNSWRAGVAKELDINLDNYCEKVVGALTHRIESRRPPATVDAPAAAS